MTFSVFLTILVSNFRNFPGVIWNQPLWWREWRDQKRSRSLQNFVASLMSKGAYIKRSVWETARPAVLHNCSPESLSLCGDLGASQEIQETWVQSLDREDPLEKENGNPLQYSCLKNAMDRGAWRATVYELQKGQTWLNTAQRRAPEFIVKYIAQMYTRLNNALPPKPWIIKELQLGNSGCNTSS